MNNVNAIEETESFILDQREWLIEHRQTRAMSWAQLHNLIGRAGSSLSAFCSGKYNGGPFAGGNGEIAKQIFRYRQTLQRQAELKVEAPVIPDFYETRTAIEIHHLLSWAQRGRMTYWVGGPGTGKTTASIEYAQRASNVWYVPVLRSTKRITALCTAVLAAMKDFTGPTGESALSTYVRGKMQDTGGLLILDDAQNLPIDLIEEVRGWYDLTGVGVAFIGNPTIVNRMEGGARAADFAQLYSRIGMRMIRALPLKDDIDALAAAWDVDDSAVIAFLHKIGTKPGGLRSCTYAMELAVMMARGDHSTLSAKHLHAAWSQLSTQPVMA
ncbi:AAA family ATPase [Sphingobium sp. SA2]|uniref:AAA family ATPase n=1 Tax=Sphingobium sp. SA2 TaxID=1524832 RepID=UPI0028C06335|nr:AAA family ATPase [Sphingobium sp. SA2]MDT7533757.1 AAA family ATPase [Sphingobium sp. SA2]